MGRQIDINKKTIIANINYTHKSSITYYLNKVYVKYK